MESSYVFTQLLKIINHCYKQFAKVLNPTQGGGAHAPNHLHPPFALHRQS